MPDESDELREYRKYLENYRTWRHSQGLQTGRQQREMMLIGRRIAECLVRAWGTLTDKEQDTLLEECGIPLHDLPKPTIYRLLKERNDAIEHAEFARNELSEQRLKLLALQKACVGDLRTLLFAIDSLTQVFLKDN